MLGKHPSTQNGKVKQYTLESGITKEAIAKTLIWDTKSFESEIINGSNSGNFFCKKANVCYSGEFLADKFHGFGIITWNDGEKQSGQWIHGVFQGLGEQILSDGEIRRGLFVDGDLNGLGGCSWRGKSTQFGTYAKNLCQGPGKEIFENGDIYIGEYINDCRQGFGQMLYRSKNYSYIGEWSNNLPHGNGRIVFGNGTVRNRKWNQGIESGLSCNMSETLLKVQQG